MRIRPANIADAPLATKVIRTAFHGVAQRFGLDADNCPTHPSNCHPEWIERALQRGGRYWLLENDGQAIGCASLMPRDNRECGLERLAVLPEQQRRGHGRMLVEHVLDVARELNMRKLQAGIIAAHTELAAWYRRLGFNDEHRAHVAHLPFEVLYMARKL